MKEMTLKEIQKALGYEVKMSEFYEKYEIIGQDGKIFTVREKQNEGE